MNSGLQQVNTAMVVEDDPLLAFSLATALRDVGVTSVVTMARAADAFAAMADNRPDLLVLDLSLSDSEDGWGIAEIAIQVFSPPPRLIFSTGAPDRVPPHLARLGTIFAKPYDPDELARRAVSDGS